MILKSIGNANKLNVIKLVKELTSLGLRESKILVDSAPITFKDNVSTLEANEFKAQFEEIGAEIEIK